MYSNHNSYICLCVHKQECGRIYDMINEARDCAPV